MRNAFKAAIPGAMLAGLATAATPPESSAPAPAQCYVDAVNTGNLDSLVACFDPAAVIVDVDRHIKGPNAIRSWAANEVMGGRLRVLEVHLRANGANLLVHWAPKGESGWRAWYDFDFRGSKLIRADLQYA
jgi:hypothetical protein